MPPELVEGADALGLRRVPGIDLLALLALLLVADLHGPAEGDGIVPIPHCFCPEDAERGPGDRMKLGVEVVADGDVTLSSMNAPPLAKRFLI